jgi:NhaP-type Na+/H+ or K+/H+ antiporter
MEWALMGIGGIFGLVALVCCIMVIVKMFQNNLTGLGIGSIVGIFVCGIGYILTLVFGWKNKDAWGLEKVMPIYTISLILCFILYGAGYAILIPKLANQVQQEMERQKANMPNNFGIDPSIEVAPQP